MRTASDHQYASRHRESYSGEWFFTFLQLTQFITTFYNSIFHLWNQFYSYTYVYLLYKCIMREKNKVFTTKYRLCSGRTCVFFLRSWLVVIARAISGYRVTPTELLCYARALGSGSSGALDATVYSRFYRLD